MTSPESPHPVEDTPESLPLPEQSENAIAEAESSTPLTVSGSVRAMLVPIVAFVPAGLLLGLRVAAQATLPHIFQPGEYVNYQNVINGLPVPRLLTWNTEWMDFLAALRDLSGVTLPLLILFVIGPLWLMIVRYVNPTFRLFCHAPLPAASPVDSESGVLSEQLVTSKRVAASAALSTPLEFYGLIKALTLLIVLGLPLAAVWILADWDDPITASSSIKMAPPTDMLIGSVWCLRLALVGIAFLVGFHRDGVAGDFTHAEWNPSRRRLPALALRGAIFGLLAYAACRLGLPQHLDDTLNRLQTLGGFNRQLCRQITTHILLSYGLVCFALGCLFAFFSPPRNRRLHSVLLLLSLCACLLSGLYQRSLSPAALASRYDIRPAVLQAIPENSSYKPNVPASGVPDGVEASREQARQLHLPFDPLAAHSGRSLVLFASEQIPLVYQTNLTLDGFVPDTNMVRQTNQFLKSRDYQSALSWSAIKNLFNVPLLRFDTTGAIRIGLQDLTHTPHNAQFAPAMQQMFSVCAATPENLSLLDQWADEAQFDFPDRESRRLMGDLYRRFGNTQKALVWYRKADMPASFLQRVGAERPMYNTGTIHGVLRWNGKPLVGAQVAVVPVLMNGLPVGMEETVRRAMRGILSEFPRSNPDLFPAYHPAPWQFRLVSASTTTDSQGAYRLDHLTEGTYSAICTLPDGVQTTLPFDNRLHITHPIPNFNLSYHQTGYDMGTTEFKWKE